MNPMVSRSNDLPRVAILWQRLSGYAHASFSALSELGVDTLVIHAEPGAEAPYDERTVTHGLQTRGWQDTPTIEEVEAALAPFDPHALLVSSWHITAYRRAARRRAGRTLRVLCMDNQWWARPKQVLGVGSSPVLVRPAYDAAFVPGERSADFARRLGFPDERIIRGLYTCDHPVFDAVAAARGDRAPDRAFVFVGRLVTAKGVDVLAEAYRRYRAMSDDPWPLIVGGTGPGSEQLAGIPGVDMLGFVQPEMLPDLLARSGCLVLPSRFEPWGVVVHEATAAGLPVVCTSVCGAASRLVLDGYNGVIVSPGHADALARGLARIARAGDGERRAMSAASRSLARQLTPERWARQVVGRVAELRHQLALGPAPWPATATPDGAARSS